ncbi:hypothetical protein BXU09_17470 [Deinococcus sp. LM3]|nr:hypothetical protein BXU09_17470 [Deinococcus sp. LM3]
MSVAQPTAQVLAALDEFAATGALRDAQVKRATRHLTWATNHDVVAYVEGQLTILGWDVYVRVGVTSAFPHDLPFVQVAATGDDLDGQVTGHLESDGNVCFTASRDVLFDPHRPVDLLTACLGLATTTLSDARTSPDNSGILDEFASHWSHALPARKQVPLLPMYFTPDDRLRPVHAWRKADRRTAHQLSKRTSKAPVSASQLDIIAVADDPAAARQFDQLAPDRLVPPTATALYIPLQAGPSLLPPAPGHPWTVASLRDVVRRHLLPDTLTALDALLMQRQSPQDLIILGIPRPTGTGPGRYAAVAVRLSGMRAAHALLPASRLTHTRLTMQSVRRLDRAYVMQRGGSNDQLSNRRVLLLGCGALGGHLAFMLAAAGIGALTLVDLDTFTLDNTFRHALGRRFVGKPKVEAMALALRERYPYLQVTPVQGRTTQVIGREVHLGDFDLIVDATGSATHHLSLADLLRAGPHPPALLSWLDALGLGGHTATVYADQPGCPRCLYSDPAAPMWNAGSFIAPGQDVGRDALGCGTAFTPFTDLDAIRTAEFTARQAVAILTGAEGLSLLRSWKGARAALRAAHVTLSARAVRKRRHLNVGEGFAQVTCPICGDA